MVVESWFRGLLKIPRKHESGSEKAVIGVQAFEVASLMSKLIHLWQTLSDKQVSRLREEISNSEGIKKLVSEDDDFIVRLICVELFESMIHVAKSVVRLGKKCSDPTLKSFEHVFEEWIKLGTDPYGWEFSYRKMDKKVKKMEHFISINATLYQEMEMLSDLEQTVKRIKGNDPEPDNLLNCQKKLVWKQQEVKNLREISLWNRTYDYTVRLLVRSLFTIFSRMNHVFGFNLLVSTEHSKVVNSDYINRSQSVSALMESVHSSESSSIPRFSSGPLGGFIAKSGPISKSNKTNHFYSGPLGGPTAKSGPISGKNRNMNFFSGPLGKPTTKSGPISGINKFSKKMWQIPQSPAFLGKKLHSKPNRSTQVGPFKGCMVAANSSPVVNCYLSSTVVHSGNVNEANEYRTDYLSPASMAHSAPSILSSRFKLSDALPETLGAAALALHYANVIVVIEKLAASPHLIGHDARDDLYNMLPSKVRNSLRARLKPYSKSLTSSGYDTALAGEWTNAITTILEWLAPLAHNMIKWQSDRSFEQQNFVSRTNVLLVQTLYFANQEKTEATITELLVGLNYVWRLGRELNTKALQECAGGLGFSEYLEHDK
ncbi:hypothetical protein P3X46_025307 [Hevea brasiliensis]|uniref:DUF668 domain-containing protein n=1 Tax=Hevea brasiliensis TaxID=3981 RepID=A0ABQ9L546_HEVBR|nr:protein PSK SIMULATOR 1 [Hevea brasiliensis]XP_021654801.2 protein PSK SIMULATOR 1 [Hevea brasiliensis]XP_021654802.2 protein PSK SIMULATOR 1 [Hevea brasiliensis]KAJ9159843.1 hypothetical protein P3X46_025307 [Hevea brasiliensis]KAJ9159844.1 hypothetical protein P3X46_025307 [Hevea brasiliensis]KAJ9159845.1 hypothetical protein P3X46_025307 [Hevea brasiliensis]